MILVTKSHLRAGEKAFPLSNIIMDNGMRFEIGVIPLGKDEYMGILAASIVIGGKSLQNANLFFETFTYQDEEWKRVRSYIETGIPAEQLKEYRVNR